MTLSDEQLQNYGLAEIDIILQTHNKRLSDYNTMPEFHHESTAAQQNRLIYDELNYDRVSLAAEFLQLLSTMTTEQRAIFDKVVDRVQSHKPGLFFISGFGGAGKTYLWRALASYFRSKGEIVLTVASSGIASLLIPGGRTAHSRFCIPLIVNEDSTCNIAHGSPLAELIIRTKLIIWDEAPMMHKHSFEAVDRTLRDLLKLQINGNRGFPFGGKVVVLGGDFRQILPVIPKGSRPMIVSSAINSSYLWHHCEVMTLHTNMRLLTGQSPDSKAEMKKFSDWILAVGDGTVGDIHDADIKLPIPDELLLPNSSDPVASIVNATYPSFLDSLTDLTYYQNRAILTPKNDIVKYINDYMLKQLPGEERTYLSRDSLHSDHMDSDRADNVHSVEFLNTISSPGLPSHELNLKVGTPVMLLRNVDQVAGLCNGTRLMITRLGKFVLEGKVLSGRDIGVKVYIPRLSLTPSDTRIPFKFQRRQFPIGISFAMTINKSQGQSLKHVGVYLPSPVFSHGQLYVALSRVTSKKGLQVLITHNDNPSSSTTSNVVYPEVFNNLK